eukprot:Phypoly_transcript_05766.p1 GENE.Phypoly_transcript_05766~~Phypoly_transcript_05766.p1  ORF type:complete len:358 (+),score=56.82 Phypoly_transcript_05766:91-1164(+)
MLQIEKNKALLASLNIGEVKATMVTPKREKPIKEKKRKFKDFSEGGGVTPRRSARVAGMPVAVHKTEDLVVIEKEDKRRIRREGDFTMESAASESGHTPILNTLKTITFATLPPSSSSPAPKKAKLIKEQTPKRISPRRKAQQKEDEDKENRENNSEKKKKAKEMSTTSGSPVEYELKKFEISNINNLSKYRELKVATVIKTVPDRIYNIAVHPSRERIVVAAGDTWGRIGIWNYGTIDKAATEDNTCVYKPHCAPVGGLQFSRCDSSKLFSSSYDGTVRCADLATGMFTQLHIKDETRTCLDTHPDSASILFVGGGDGVLTMIDTRTPKVNEYEVHQKKIHSVSVCPGDPNIVATG